MSSSTLNLDQEGGFCGSQLDIDFKARYEAVSLVAVGVCDLVDAAELGHHSVQEEEIVRAHPHAGPATPHVTHVTHLRERGGKI